MAQGKGKIKKSTANKKPQKKALGPKKGGEFSKIYCMANGGELTSCDGSNASRPSIDRTFAATT